MARLPLDSPCNPGEEQGNKTVKGKQLDLHLHPDESRSPTLEMPESSTYRPTYPAVGRLPVPRHGMNHHPCLGLHHRESNMNRYPLAETRSPRVYSTVHLRKTP